MISVLVVTCPCALSLATPTALAQATQTLKNRGLVITRGYVLERLSELNAIAFDKTGTLTEGRFALTSVELLPGAPELTLNTSAILSICRALEAHSPHRIRQAFADVTEPCPVAFQSVHNETGAGVEGHSAEGVWRLGSATFTGQTMVSSSGTVLFLTCNDRALARLTLSDPLRSTVASTLTDLQQLGIHSHVLTGDSNPAPEQALRQAGLNGDYHAGLKPDDKVSWVDAQADRSLAVIGDGINDAPLLARAPLSIAMMDATDLTKTQADILLLTNNLAVLSYAVRLARKNQRIIRQNLAWALVYNAIALPIAAMGWVSPWQAAIGMSVSSLLVVGNALRLRK